jgi:hypothetical protein
MKQGVVEANVKILRRLLHSIEIHRDGSTGAPGGVMRGSNPEPEAPKRPPTQHRSSFARDPIRSQGR